MHDQNDDTPRRRVAGPATLSRAIRAQRGQQPGMAPPPPAPPQQRPVADPFASNPREFDGPSYGAPEIVVRDEHEGSNTAAVVAASIAGIVGALVWFGVAAITGYEIGWIAWGVGAGVGAAYHQQGGNPTLGMATCAGIAILAIVAGKYLAFQTVIGSELESLHETGEMSELYVWLRGNSERYTSAPDKTAVSRELAAELYYGEPDGSYVDAEEVEEFQAEMGPLLERVDQHETYESFHAAEMSHFEETADFADMFDFVDIIFLAFGVVSAIKLANGEST